VRNKAVRQCNDLHAKRKVFFLGKSKDALSKAAVFYIFLECYDKLIRIGKASTGAGRKMKKRLDVLLVERGLATSREKAKAMIMAGEVLVDNEREDKAGSMFPEEVEIVLKGKPLPYVSRGGLKLEKAMKNFDLTLDGKVCMDVGASTGGFTDCMLQNGAVKVYSVDVGHGQLDWKLRNDPRVVCMERTNIRYVVPEDIEERPSFVSIDVSFISLDQRCCVPVRKSLMEENGRNCSSDQAAVEAGREKSDKKVVSP